MGGHIAHPVGLGEDARQHPQQVIHLVGAGVIGAHQRVGRVEGTVKKPGAGVLRRHFQAGGVHPGAGGKHDVGIVMGHIFQHLLRIHLRVDVFPAADTHPARERFEGERRRMKRRYGESLLRDPFYNPNLTLDREDFSESDALPKDDPVPGVPARG